MLILRLTRHVLLLLTGTGSNRSVGTEDDKEERSLHEELAHGEAAGDLHSKLMLLVAALVLSLAVLITPMDLALALGSDVLTVVGGTLAAVSRGSRYLMGTLSDAVRMVCGWIYSGSILATADMVHAIASAITQGQDRSD